MNRTVESGGSGKSTLVPIVLFFLCTVVLCSTKYLDLKPKCNVCTISAVRKTPTSDNSKRAPRITIGSTFFSFA
jgi:hypothetical protein